MIRKKIYISLLFVANMFILVHFLLPHHHHNGESVAEVCIFDLSNNCDDHAANSTATADCSNTCNNTDNHCGGEDVCWGENVIYTRPNITQSHFHDGDNHHNDLICSCLLFAILDISEFIESEGSTYYTNPDISYLSDCIFDIYYLRGPPFNA